jgi:hypothetical protein
MTTLRAPRTTTLTGVTAAPYEFLFQDNESFAYEGAPHCPDCTRVLDDSWIDPEFELALPGFDISVTSDGCVVASTAFVATCEGLGGIAFAPIASAPGWSVVRVERVVHLDPFMNRLLVGPACRECGHPRYSVRDGPLRLLAGERIQPGFSRTDLTFGDTADFGRQHPIRVGPVLVADEMTVRLLKLAELRGVHVIAPD